MNERTRKVLDLAKAEGVENLVVTKGSDIKYLTGFTGEYGTVVAIVNEAGTHMITDDRFVTQIKAECPDVQVYSYSDAKNRPSGLFLMAGEVLGDLGLAEVGYVADDLSHGDFLKLQTYAGDTRFNDVKDYAAQVRAVKEPGEIELIKQACQISMRSFYALLDSIKPGVTEIDVANALEYEFRSRGGSGFCFETIVASGPDNGACPHATASGRKLEYGDFVTIDFGTYYKGYCSDITRTVVIGRAREPKLYEVWKVVEEAKQAGAAALHDGVTSTDLNDAIVKVIKDAGYGISHGMGHQFGLDIHEAPYIGTRGVTEVAGMVHTIEPGIYLPGVGGVRQEDDYLVTEDGYERLTYITDHLIEL